MMNHFCQQASRLVSDRLDRDLRLGERLQLWLHLAMCRLCRGNARAMEQMHRVLHDKVAVTGEGGGETGDSGMRLDEVQRRKIESKISDKLS